MCHFWYNSNRQMLPPPAQDPAVYAIVGAAGVALIVLTRWAARRGGRWRSWIALSIGDLRFTEVVGAFLIGASLGGLLAPQLDAGGVTGPPRPMGPAGRFGSFNWSRLPLMLGITAAVLDVLTQIDVVGLLLRGSTQRGTLTTYIGSDARVVRAIRTGGYGDILIHDQSGQAIVVAATAEADIAPGTTVRITGRKGANPVVTAIDALEHPGAAVDHALASPTEATPRNGH